MASGTDELAALLEEAGGIEERLAAVTDDLRRKEEIKARLRELAAEQPDLFEARTALTRAVEPTASAAGCTVTAKEPPPLVDYEGFRAEVGCEVFHRVFRIRAADLDMEAWDEAVEGEAVREASLQAHTSLGPAPTPSVRLLPRKGGLTPARDGGTVDGGRG